MDTSFANQFPQNVVQVSERSSEGFYRKQVLFRFDNGLGASVVWNDSPVLRLLDSTPNWELAVIEWSSPVNFSLTYDYPSITTDVLPNLTDAQIVRVLKKISKLTRSVK